VQHVALRKQQLAQIGAILPRNANHQCNFAFIRLSLCQPSREKC
jgi:hypothetical protein